MTTPTPEDLGNLKTAAWQALRRHNETGLAKDAAAFIDACEALDAACDQYRREHHPDALNLFALCDHELGQTLTIHAEYASGTECVYDATVQEVCS